MTVLTESRKEKCQLTQDISLVADWTVCVWIISDVIQHLTDLSEQKGCGLYLRVILVYSLKKSLFSVTLLIYALSICLPKRQKFHSPQSPTSSNNCWLAIRLVEKLVCFQHSTAKLLKLVLRWRRRRKLALFMKRIINFQQMIRCTEVLLRKDWRIINLLRVAGLQEDGPG